MPTKKKTVKNLSFSDKIFEVSSSGEIIEHEINKLESYSVDEIELEYDGGRGLMVGKNSTEFVDRSGDSNFLNLDDAKKAALVILKESLKQLKKRVEDKEAEIKAIS